MATNISHTGTTHTDMTRTIKQRARLIALLNSLFQLDQPDLDFGFYKIMHAKQKIVSDFLQKDLLKHIQDAFGEADEERIEIARLEYVQAIEQAKKYGALDPEDTEAVKEAKAAYNAAKNSGTNEGDIYEHLYRFFERYYDNGDFMSRRYYARETGGKAAPYAIPYDGREVYLHWANRDQYYIKTAEYLTNVTFDIAKHFKNIEERTLKKIPEQLKLHCRIVDATEGEHNNNKASDKTDRYFLIHEKQPVLMENGELVLQFEYRPDGEKSGTASKWQEKRIDEAEAVIFNLLSGMTQADKYNIALKEEIGKDKNKRTLLRKYLNQYTKRNTTDYFIHKDLGSFLKRELDFYIKNEIMRLDDIDMADAPQVQSYLDKIKVLRKIAGQLISFLAQMEDFQKKLWLKKKFVTDTQYCITLDRIPDDMYNDIATNDAQRAEWISLFAIDELDGYSEPLTADFLKANPFLVLDTAFFSSSFKDALMAEIHDLDENLDGLLIHSENFQALGLMQEKYREQVKCIYIDPPFKTGKDFLYKDSYLDSSWLTLMSNRLSLGKSLLNITGSQFLHLDHNANFFGRMLLDQTYGTKNFKNEIIWHYQSGGRQETAFSRKHDTIFFYEKRENTGSFYSDAIGVERGITKKNNMKRGVDPDGRVYFSIKSAGKIYKYYEDEKIIPDDVWSDISHLQQKDPQRTGFLTQKPEHLSQRLFDATTEERDWVLDYYLGSGTTVSSSIKMKRRYMGIEMGEHFETKIIPRLKKDIYGIKTGIGRDLSYKRSHAFKYIRLESYEDTLNNLSFKDDAGRDQALQSNDDFRRDYMLKYWLEFETKGSPSLLNIEQFDDPTAYMLSLKKPGSDETQEKTVDLVESFNWLIGLHIEHLDMWRSYDASFKREPDPELPDDEGTRLILANDMTESDDGEFALRKIEGRICRTPGDMNNTDRVLVIWRKLTGDLEKDNLILDEWFKKYRLSTSDSEFDLIYVNGSNNLQNQRLDHEHWKVRLIEEAFHDNMWDMEA